MAGVTSRSTRGAGAARCPKKLILKPTGSKFSFPSPTALQHVAVIKSGDFWGGQKSVHHFLT
jgi:hypothetical protein